MMRIKIPDVTPHPVRPERTLRRRSPRRVAALAAAAVTAVAAAAAMTAPAAAGTISAAATVRPAPSWHIVKQVRTGPFGGFTAITAAGKTGGWAFEGYTRPSAWIRHGTAWTQVRFPGQAGEEVVATAATSPADVWAFTSGGALSRALRWDGRTWTVRRTFAMAIGGAVVLGPGDVWVFGEPYQPGAGLGTWHYNGRTWSRVASGHGLAGGSALTATSIWAFGGTSVAHWNGHTWSRTSVARLLPPRQQLNFPTVTGIYAQSRDSVYAIGSGNAQDEGGPTVLLHYNGRSWAKLTGGYYGTGTQPVQQVCSDGHGGLWIPMPGTDGRPSYLLHYVGGHLTQAPLPVPASQIAVESVALIPGTTSVLAAGNTHAPGTPGSHVHAVILQYGS